MLLNPSNQKYLNDITFRSYMLSAIQIIHRYYDILAIYDPNMIFSYSHQSKKLTIRYNSITLEYYERYNSEKKGKEYYSYLKKESPRFSRHIEYRDREDTWFDSNNEFITHDEMNEFICMIEDKIDEYYQS